MNNKIEKLTDAQAEYLPVFRKEYLDLAVKGYRTDRARLESAISDAYAVIGKPSPMVVILQSPASAMMAIKFLQKFAAGELGPKLVDQLGDQLVDQLWGQLRSQLWGQLGDQLWGQLRGQLWDQLWGQLKDQLGDQLGVQLRDQLVGQLGGQLRGQLGGQLLGQLRDQLLGQLGDQLRGQLRGQLWDQLMGQLGDQDIWNSDFLCGSQDLYWIAYYKFAEHIGVKYTADQSNRLDIIKRVGSECEWWWPFEGMCIVSERPTEVHFDEQRRLHAEGKPAVLYADGYAMYNWHGTTIPAEWVTDKNSLTPKVALQQENLDQRRSACEIIGWSRILKELNAVTIQKDDDPQIGELVEVDIPDVGREKFLRVLCGTGREFALPVPPEMSSALEANAWTYGLEPKDYMPEIRT